jgi:DNA-binding NarL/FixJ family response regulator
MSVIRSPIHATNIEMEHRMPLALLLQLLHKRFPVTLTAEADIRHASVLVATGLVDAEFHFDGFGYPHYESAVVFAITDEGHAEIAHLRDHGATADEDRQKSPAMPLDHPHRIGNSGFPLHTEEPSEIDAVAVLEAALPPVCRARQKPAAFHRTRHMNDVTFISSGETASTAMAPYRQNPLSGVCAPAAGMWPDFLTGQEGAPVRVLLIDDDEFVRRVIAQELLSDLRIQLEGQANSIREGRKLLATHEFDVLMVDLRLSDGLCFELIDEARRHRCNGEVIVISAFEDDDHVLRAFELGATGYLLKNAWLQSFPEAVLHVANGGAAITPRLARRLLHLLNQHPREHPADDAPPLPAPPSHETTLSRRENQILRFVALGYVSVEIGAKLGITGQTVNAHIKSIYKKLHVHSRAQAVNLAVQAGLI